MSWHGPWVLAEIFVGWGRGGAKKGPPHGNNPPYKEIKIAKINPHDEKGPPYVKKVAERPSHGEKAPYKYE